MVQQGAEWQEQKHVKGVHTAGFSYRSKGGSHVLFLLDVIWPGNCLLHESQRDLEESASHQ